MNRDRTALWAAASLMLGILAWHLLYYWREWVDDAFITFRYSRNLWMGNGLVWNPGERLEGMTNLLWALLLAPFSDGDALLAAKLLSLGCTLGAAALALAWARPLGAWGAALVLAPIALPPYVALWTMGGLETVASMLCVTTIWACAGRRGYASAIAAALGPLVRPDVAAVSALWGMFALYEAWHKPARRTELLRGVGLVAAVGVGTAAFKLGYYGDLLPNTFYCKKAVYPYLPGQSYTLAFLFGQSVLWGTCVIAAALAACFRPAARLPAAIVAVYGLFVGVWTGGDFFLNYRFFVPILPAVGATFALALVGAPSLLRHPLNAVLLGSACLLAPIATVSNAQNTAKYPSPNPTVVKKTALLPYTLGRDSGTWVGGQTVVTALIVVFVPEGARVAYSDIGLPGFVIDNDLTDLYGLTDRRYALRDGGTLLEAITHALDTVDVFLIRLNAPQGQVVDTRKALQADPRFSLVWRGMNHEVFARNGSWRTVSDQELSRRIAQVVRLTPRMPGVHRTILDALPLAGAHPDLTPIRENTARLAVAHPGLAGYIAEGICWAESCVPERRLSWSFGAPAEWSFIPPEGGDVEMQAAAFARLTEYAGVPTPTPFQLGP